MLYPIDPITRQEIKCCSGASHPSCIPVNVPTDDQFFVGGHRQRCIDMIRSLAGVNTDCPLGNYLIVTDNNIIK